MKTAVLAFFITALASFGGSAPEVHAANPCGRGEIVNPCNPCAPKPVVPIRPARQPSVKNLVKQGERAWNNETLSTSGFSCMTCHDDHELLTDKPWPHYIEMARDVFTLDQMINFCMLNPMGGKKIDPFSLRMTAMSAFYAEYMKTFKPTVPKKGKGNPCGGGMMNPCGR